MGENSNSSKIYFSKNKKKQVWQKSDFPAGLLTFARPYYN
jgi:hypothetical protein